MATRRPLPSVRYMIGTIAHHDCVGDVSKESPSICVVYYEDEDGNDWIGQWLEEPWVFDVRFPKQSTRDLTWEEKQLYHKGRLVVGSNTHTCGGVDLEQAGQVEVRDGH